MNPEKRERSETDSFSNTTPRSQSGDVSDDEVSDYKSGASDYDDEFDSIESKKEKGEDGKFGMRTIVRTLSGKLKSKERADTINFCSIPVSDKIHKRIKKGIPPSKLSKLLKKTKHIDQVDDGGQSVLHLTASLPGFLEHMKVIIKKGGNVNLQDNNGFTPLFCSILANNLEGCLLLLEYKKIDVKITNNEKSNVLHYLTRLPINEQNIILYRKVLDSLTEKGIDLNRKNRQGETPLHSACMKVNVPAVAFLVERGADCNSQTTMGETPLHYAARSGNLKLFRLIMENGADPTIKNEAGVTPADVAEEYNYTDLLEALQWIMEAKINSNFTNNNSRPEIVKMGVLQIFHDGNWKKSDCVASTTTLTCYENDQEKTISTVNLSETTNIYLEEGTVMNENELLWGFIVETSSESLFLATRDPHEREKWIATLTRISNHRKQYYSLYQKLKSHSHLKIEMRKRNRKIAKDHVNTGVQLLYDICKSNPTPRVLIDTIINNIPKTSACLSEILDIDDVDFVNIFIKVLNHHKALVEFIKSAISYDIGKSKDGETLFREMSLSTRLLSIFFEGDEGREFLKNTVHLLVQSAVGIETSLEVNPNKITEKEGTVNFQANLEKVCEISQIFLDEVLCYPNRYPQAFREIMKHTKEAVDAVYSNMTHAVIGGFVFLRFLCPAIVSPHKYGLLSKPPDKKALRTLILISKLLQSVSNGVEFDGSKEDYMRSLNPFIHRNRLHVAIFFDKLVDIQEKGDLKPFVLESSKLEEYEKIVCNNITGLKPKLWQLIEICVKEEDESLDCDKEGVDPDELDY